MDVIRKDATITNTDDAFPGTFEVVLSAPTKDRDGDTLLPDEWKQPLPDHVTFDMDHGMSVATTVGSGRPRLEADGTLRVSGTYSSLPRAQEVRTLVKEGHINRTSVAFMSEKTQKDGVTAVTRELLNGAFVAVPSNREAVILESKALLEAKTGKRNSKADQEHLDAIARHAVALGATFKSADNPQGGDTAADEDIAAAKGVHVEISRAASADPLTLVKSISDAIREAVRKGTVPDVVASITVGNAIRKDADTEDASDPVALISATDAAIDQAIDLLAQVDATTLPAEVQQAIALIQAADATVDELLDALGIPDPDEDAETADTTEAAAAEAAAEAERIDIIRKAAEARFSLLTERI